MHAKRHVCICEKYLNYGPLLITTFFLSFNWNFLRMKYECIKWWSCDSHQMTSLYLHKYLIYGKKFVRLKPLKLLGMFYDGQMLHIYCYVFMFTCIVVFTWFTKVGNLSICNPAMLSLFFSNYITVQKFTENCSFRKNNFQWGISNS